MDVFDLDENKIKNELKKGEITVSVFGLGKIGLPLAAVLADEGVSVIGVDIDEEVVDNVNEGINPLVEEPGMVELIAEVTEKDKLKATDDGVWAAEESDIMIILVPTLLDEDDKIDLEPVFKVTENISKGLEGGNIVITEATMPPGSTEKLMPILEKSGLKIGEFGLAHAPERTMTGTAIEDIRGNYPKIIGASDEKTENVVKSLYEAINRKGVLTCSDISSAEAVKVFEGVYRDVNIGLANELALFCEERGLDVYEIIERANSQPYCDIHRPGAGVGGPCIPIYPWFLINQSEKNNDRLMRTARKINDSMPYHVVELTIQGLKDIGRSIDEARILILGLTFRGGVKEFKNTPAKPVIDELKKMGCRVFVYDPLCDDSDAGRFNAIWKDDLDGIDALVILTDHEEFKDLDLSQLDKKNTVIIDGRNIIKSDEGDDYIIKRVGNVKG